MVLCICINMFVGCRANNHVHSAPTSAGGDSPNDMNCVVDANSNDLGLPGGHADECPCGITGGSNDYFNSDQQDNMDHLQANHQLGAESLNMVEAFAGVGAFDNGWRKLGNKVIRVTPSRVDRPNKALLSIIVYLFISTVTCLRPFALT